MTGRRIIRCLDLLFCEIGFELVRVVLVCEDGQDKIFVDHREPSVGLCLQDTDKGGVIDNEVIGLDRGMEG